MNKIIILFILFALFLMSNCTKKNTSSIADKPLDTGMRVGIVGSPKLDWVSNLLVDEQIVSLLHAPLLDLQLIDGKLKPVPELLSAWEFTSPTSLKLTLRQNILWENQEALSATQLIHSWKELLQSYPENQSASLLFCIANAKNFAERRVLFPSVGIQMQNNFVIDLSFHSPCPHFPYLLSSLSLSPRLNYPFSLTSGKFLPCPFDTLGDWKLIMHWPKNEVQLKLGQRHWDKEAPYKQNHLQFSFWKETKEIFPLFEDNRLDVVLGAQRSHIPPSITFPSFETVVLVFNSYRKPFQLSKVRELFEKSIDKEELQRLAGAVFDQAHGLFPFLGNTNMKSDFAPLAAKHTLSELKIGTISLSIPSDPLLQDVANNLVAQWKKNLNMDIEITIGHEDNSMLRLEKFRPDFYKKALGLEEWTVFTSSDFLSPLLSSLSADKAVEPFKLYEDRLVKMEKWLIEEEKLIFPLLTERRVAYLQKGITGLQFKPVRGVFDFNSIQKNP